MTDTRDLLVEIGTEELPPKALASLVQAFAKAFSDCLVKAELSYREVQSYATPRRLALLVRDLASAQADREVLRKGPAVAAAFDEHGQATKAALGFAQSCGVGVDSLEQMANDKGEWLAFRNVEHGRTTVELTAGFIETALHKLPIPKRMRWGTGAAEFVRPVHWVVILFGEQVVDAEILGVRSGRETRGHRFHHPEPISIGTPAEYASVLEREGKVLADLEARRTRVGELVAAAATQLDGTAIVNEHLLNEVTALVEWPVAIAGSFEEAFLELPGEVLIASMQDHQKYFPVTAKDGKLLPSFITIANIDSTDPQAVRAGNERVIRPRLSDAAFFWRKDLQTGLAENFAALENIVYQRGLGSLADKSRRILASAVLIAEQLGYDPGAVERAAYLSRCDLVSEMVGEFPELQGIMGRYYAAHCGESAEVCTALDELYMPRQAGGSLPATATGRILVIADRLDTLVGIFGLGNKPSGDKDPFGMRRAALGCLRTIVECDLDLDLEQLLNNASQQYQALPNGEAVVAEVFDFMLERMRYYCLDAGISADVFDAVHALRPTRPSDFLQRLQAVTKFRDMPAAQSLAAANKRITNILRKAEEQVSEQIADNLLHEAPERALAEALYAAAADVQPLLAERNYSQALVRLAELGGSVDAFFDAVMVMADDQALRRNRLALLNNLSGLFLRVADVGLLQTEVKSGN